MILANNLFDYKSNDIRVTDRTGFPLSIKFISSKCIEQMSLLNPLTTYVRVFSFHFQSIAILNRFDERL